MMPTTTKGRVVYTRPKHYFNCKDASRIVKKSGCEYFIIRSSEWANLQRKIIAFAAANRDLFVEGEWHFGGGEFGGGGATREFGTGSSVGSSGQVISFIMEA